MTPVGSTETPAAVAGRLRAVAGTLAGLSATVGHEASEATSLIRRVADHARETAAVAADLDALAAVIDDSVRAQATLLAEARAASGASLEVIDELGRAAGRIGAISSMIGEIAGRSRLLALNARIEAARTGEGGRGFDVVANEMTTLAQSTWSATRDIEQRSTAIHGDVAATRSAFDGVSDLITRQESLIDHVVGAVARQRGSAGAVARLTGEAVGGVEEAAVAIGRVSSAATTVDLLARQIARAADTLRETA